jgi:putative membrane-bound dehydrogenase-like protein
VGAPWPADKVARETTFAEAGFRLSVVAAEPEVQQPIAMTFDERGRLWVVECLSYPAWQAQGPGADRVTIFEDADGDGRFERRKRFLENGRNVTSVAVGFGGVWLCSAPELLFIPDRDRDDVPDGPPEPVLDGWTLQAKHNIVNGLTYGPDGWLYGCHGILADSLVGRPGAAAAERVRMNCGIWRYHPTRHVFEVVAHGTTNPWGVAFDEQGELFVANCVIKHLFHISRGGRYERMYGKDFDPHVYGLISSCADHIHWAGGYWFSEGGEGLRNDAAGGGHAHSGAMVYLGDTWPARYRNAFFTLNVHGRRMNQDVLRRAGSTFVASHAPDVVRFPDPWFRGTTLLGGPDGSVYVADWSDTGECHDYIDIHRENGRIYRIRYGSPERRSTDLALASDPELVLLLEHDNDWLATQARRLLHERAVQNRLAGGTLGRLRALARDAGVARLRLRALWTLHAAGAADAAVWTRALEDRDDAVRRWAVLQVFDHRDTVQSLAEPLWSRLLTAATTDPSAAVRRCLASALQRLGSARRLELALRLVARAEDAGDEHLGQLLWIGIEPLVAAGGPPAVELLSASRIPLLRRFAAQRMALRGDLDHVVGALVRAPDAAAQADWVQGLTEAMEGRRPAATPRDWTSACARLASHPQPRVRSQARMLAVLFGDAAVIRDTQHLAADANAPIEDRRRAVELLLQARPAELVPLLLGLLDQGGMRATAIRGLAHFDAAQTPAAILSRYALLTPEARAEAVTTLTTRADYALALLDAVDAGSVPKTDVTPFAARQMRELKDARIAPRLARVWGDGRQPALDKAAAFDKYRRLLTSQALRVADLKRGRRLFDRTCGGCHTLFDSGGAIGPELTGGQRANLDYVLENVLDPNAVAWDRFRATYFELADGRLVSGIVLKENDVSVTIQTQTGAVAVPASEVVSRTLSSVSMMPEGLFDQLAANEVIDLVAYLQSPVPVALADEPAR